MKEKIEGVSEKLLKAAEKEFLEKGFMNAGLREIAKQCDVSTHSIYTRFKDKEELFDAVIADTLEDMEKLKKEHMDESYSYLNHRTMNVMWEKSLETHRALINYFYDRFNDMKLLLCCSQGTRHENFINDFVKEATKESIDFIEEEKRQGLSHQEITEKEFHLLLTAYWTTVFEPIIHDFTREEALKHCEYVCKLFNWKVIYDFD